MNLEHYGLLFRVSPTNRFVDRRTRPQLNSYSRQLKLLKFDAVFSRLREKSK